MKVFISWSGEVSRTIAVKLYDWLPMVLQSVQPYMSSESIDKGTRWASSIANELEGTGVGIVVLTHDNLNAPWIYFEAGALAKVVGDSKLAPLLCGLKPSDIGTPLSQFQVTVFNKEDVLKLLRSINGSLGDEALPDSRLEKMHNALWGELAQDIDPIIASASIKSPDSSKVPEDETSRILEELLVLSRQQSQTLLNPEKLISRDVVRMIAEVVSDTSSEGVDPEHVRYLVRELFLQWRSLRDLLSLPETDDDESRGKEINSAAAQVEEALRLLIDLVESRRRRRSRLSLENEAARARNIFAHGVTRADDEPK